MHHTELDILETFLLQFPWETVTYNKTVTDNSVDLINETAGRTRDDSASEQVEHFYR